MNIERFDIALEINATYLMFPSQGGAATKKFLKRMSDAGENTCWLIDTTSADLIGYAFVASFLPEFTNDFGRVLASNSAIAVLGKLVSDRDELLKGLAREVGDIGSYSDHEALDQIALKRRSLLMVSKDNENNSHRDYLGLRNDGSEDDLIETLNFADRQDKVTVDSIRDTLGIRDVDAGRHVATLTERRLLLAVGKRGRDDVYSSLFRLLEDRGQL